MTARRTPAISSRKKPQQARSSDLVAAILEAAVQVLAKEGAQRFTTTRVAEKAGVSVGSIYQYFPNKAAILFRLQSDEWRETTRLLRGILEDASRPPLERLRALVHAFVQSECDEAAMRVRARATPPRSIATRPRQGEAKAASKARRAGVHARGAARRRPRPSADVAARPDQDDAQRRSARSSRRRRARPREIAAYADAMADMFCAYLEKTKRSAQRSAR